MSRTYWERRAKGLCGYCGARPAIPGRSSCEECTIKRKRYTIAFSACRYFAREDTIEIPRRVLLDVLALLKAQPRVMTLDEIGNALKMPLWKETKSAHKDLYTGWVLAYDIQTGQGITGTRLGMSEPSGRMVWYKLDDYGKKWRCWTARPTDEQRKAVKWDD
jgi:hypothetical protein